MLVSVSFTKYKHNPKETIKLINETNADYLHIDLMDGKFTENKQQIPTELNKLLSVMKKPLDVHIMANEPIKYLEYFANLNTEYFIFHIEAIKDPISLINKIHSYGLKCGISIKPKTKLSEIVPYLDKIEQVLIMSVEPGMGGQSFILETTDKINDLKSLNKNNLIISVDGGINSETITLVQNANMVVSGSYICMSDDFQKNIDILRN